MYVYPLKLERDSCVDGTDGDVKIQEHKEYLWNYGGSPWKLESDYDDCLRSPIEGLDDSRRS